MGLDTLTGEKRSGSEDDDGNKIALELIPRDETHCKDGSGQQAEQGDDEQRQLFISQTY